MITPITSGFELIGFDARRYTNRGVRRHEIRFGFGLCPNRRDGRR